MKSLFFIALFLFQMSSAWSFLIMGKSTKRLEKWTDYSKNDDLNLRYLVNILIKSPTGKNLLARAKAKAQSEDKNLFEVIKVGEASLTDTTLTRKFKMHNPGEVVFESSSVVFVNQYLAEQDAVLDLAHELTHFIYREPFNPYITKFTLKNFIRSTVEGPGGEVNAFLSECSVLKELYGEAEIKNSVCEQVYNFKRKTFDRTTAIQKFYHIGNHYRDFKNTLHQHQLAHVFPELKSEKAHFISSAYGKPYPVAALEEYEHVMSKACQNDFKRIELYQSKNRRAPASLQESYIQRCKNFATE